MIFGIKNCDFCNEKDIKDYNQYKIKLEIIRTKLHSRYQSCIALGIVIWLIATGTANNEEFSDWVSFASTIASIILSVVAIIMSISGESQMNTIRDRMEEAVQEMDQVLKSIEKENATSLENTKELRDAIIRLDAKIAGMPDEVIEKMQNKFNISTNDNQEVESIEIGWVNNNGK